MISMLHVVISIVAILALMGSAGWALRRDRSRIGLFLCLALLVTALLELFDLCALTVAGAISWKMGTLFAEALLPPFWLLCSFTYARQQGPWKIGRLRQGLVAFSFLLSLVPIIYPVSAFFYAPDFPAERLLFLGTTGFFYYVGIMACLVFALINLETTLANASPEAFWKIKLDIVGLGIMLAVLIFYFSQALLYRTLNMNFTSLRSFLFVVAVAMMTYSRRQRGGKVRIQVSRQAAFKSIVLSAVGIYLIMLGLLGEGMRYFGSIFPRSVPIAIAFLAGTTLLVLLLSERVKREVKVVLHKNFYQHKHDYRTQWLHFTERLATSLGGDELLRRILIAYCDIFGIQGAALFQYEESADGYCMTAQYEMATKNEVILQENSLVIYLRDRTWVFNVKDHNPEILTENEQFFQKYRLSIIIPLYANDRLEGFIALGPVIKANEVFIYEDYDLMKTIARQASLAILNQRLAEQLTKAREMEAIGNVATFVVHDLKNLVATLSLVVDNATQHMQNPEFQQDMLSSLTSTVDKMQMLIGRLNNLGDKELLNLKAVNLLNLVENTAHLLVGKGVSVTGMPVIAVVDVGEIQKVVLNLLINGIEASVTSTPILAEVGSAATAPFIRITDRGCGMSSRFIRSELFTPFRTTKKQGLGIGLYQCRQIIAAHGGKIEVSSVEGEGSVFTVWFPSPETSFVSATEVA